MLSFCADERVLVIPSSSKIDQAISNLKKLKHDLEETGKKQGCADANFR